jgi:moderate conductance mechanosensitive channel
MERFALTLQAHCDKLLTWLLTSGVRIILILVIAVLVCRLVRMLTERLNFFLQGLTDSLERQKRAQTLSHIVRTIATTVLFSVTTMTVLSEIGVNLAPILAAAGIGGLAVGFGAQHLVRDVITGFFILLEDQIRVGDVVKVGDKSGLVERISLRVLTLRDFDGSVHVVPHSTITTVTNMTKDFSYAVLDVAITPRENLDRVTETLRRIGAQLRQDPRYATDILEDLEIVGIDKVTAAEVTLKLRIKTVPIKQWHVARIFRHRLKEEFDASGIEIL